MTTWWQAVAELRHAREGGVLVTVADVRGHAPREAGAKMVVARDRTWGTVGGGNLEAEAVRAHAGCSANTRRPETLESHLSDKAPFQHGVQCCGGEVAVLLEPLPWCRPWRSSASATSDSSWPGSWRATTSTCTSSTPAPTSSTPERLAALADAVAARARARRAGAARAGAGRAAPRHPCAGDDARPRGGRRVLRRGAAHRPARHDRSDRLVGASGPGSASSWRRRPPGRGDRPDHHADRPARARPARSPL